MNLKETEDRVRAEKKIIAKIRDDIAKRADDVLAYAARKNVPIGRINRDNMFYVEVIKKYPFLEFTLHMLPSFHFYQNDDGESFARSIVHLYNERYNEMMYYIGLKSVNKKNRTISLSIVDSPITSISWDRKIQSFGEFVDISFGDPIKTFANGRVDYQLPEEEFSKFMKIYEFETEATSRIIKDMTNEDVNSWIFRGKHLGKYAFINPIARRLNINIMKETINYRMIIDVAETRGKKVKSTKTLKGDKK